MTFLVKNKSFHVIWKNPDTINSIINLFKNASKVYTSWARISKTHNLTDILGSRQESGNIVP